MEEILKRLDQIEQSILKTNLILADHRKSIGVLAEKIVSVSKHLSEQYGKLLPEVQLANYDVERVGASFDRHENLSTKNDFWFASRMNDHLDMIIAIEKRLDKLEGR